MAKETIYKFPFVCPKCGKNNWKVECETTDITYDENGEKEPSSVYDMQFGTYKFICMECNFNIEKDVGY